MTRVLRLEEIGFFLFSIFLFSTLSVSWWWFPVLLLAPDLAMLGYAFGPRAGAWIYNVVHHRTLSLALYVAGVWATAPWLSLAGVILLGHSSLDRVLGYGLKHSDSFTHTHLGWIGHGSRGP
jgi:hypothetical protein